MGYSFSEFNELVKSDSVFWFCALAGSCLFLIQLILNLFGSSFEDGDLDSSDFKWLSKQALAGFLMMFGWVGLTCTKEFELSKVFSSMIALLCGFISIFVIGFIFKSAKKLSSTGTIFKIEDAIGKEASVYLRIPKGGVGRISISLHHFTREIDAVSHNAEDIPSFAQVQIIKKMDEKTVLVIPIK